LPLSTALIDELIGEESLDEVIKSLFNNKISQRKISLDLGISRSHVRKVLKIEDDNHE